MAGLLGCGELYANRKVNGVWQGLVRLGNATKFEIKANSELKQRTSKSCDNYGQPVDSVTIQRPAEVSVTLDDLNRDNLAIVFLGDSETETLAGGTVTSEAHTVVKLDTLLRTEQENVSAVSITDATDTTTYVEGTDYVIDNAALGLVKVLSTGAIGEGDVVHVSYTAGASVSTKTAGGTDANIKLRYLLVGKNLADQKPLRAEIWESNASPQSGVDFLSEEFSTVELSGTANIDATKGNAFEVRTEIVQS